MNPFMETPAVGVGSDGGDRRIYDELRSMAARLLERERPGQTLQPTALVHEAYFRLHKADPARFENRSQYFAAAANAMRQILIEAARRKAARKRGGGWSRQPLEPDGLAVPEIGEPLIALDEALQKLAKSDAMVAEVIKLRFYGGLTHPEIAETLAIGLRTVDSYWAYGKAWLAAELEKSAQ